ncbi:conserved hypothetical protein [Nitrosococcus halophilus Nc 4]|uniref:Uncharacterized protein n=1 Tax=Nitrosococcus halophilus (strain Nc4) TaxID=472759 RepID=D5BY93_NITHN|nr:hypothetical protein [Nitrosococcus halophilus]ADE14076.1 conserved hypothetical protein [Nitrosococcus halophilus Nc 4]
MSPQPLSWLLVLLLVTINLDNINAEVLSLPTPPRGIQSLGLEISGIHRDYQRYGLKKATLTEQVTQQLQAAGFNLAPVEATRDSPTAALLQVDLNLVRAYSGYPYAITVKLIQKIQLAGPQGHFIPVTTWSTSRTGFLRSIELHYLQDYTADLIQQFIEAAQVHR